MSFSGLIAAAFTPMASDGSLALHRIAPLVERLGSDGVSGLYVLGSTGEGPSLSASERRQVAEAFVNAAKGRLRVIVQVGHDSLVEACGLAAHAEAIGADAVSATPPAYFKPESIPDLVSCMVKIAAAASSIPFYYYHIPQATGVDLPMPAFLESARKDIPNLAGLKFSDPRHFALQACIEIAEGTLQVYTGVDEMLLGAAVLGVHGAVGSTYNFAAPLYLRMLDHLREGRLDEARRLQGRSVEMINTIVRCGGRGGLKAVMPLIGLDCGPSRLPVRTPNTEQRDHLRSELERIGYFDWGR